jgi:hypothetical protein
MPLLGLRRAVVFLALLRFGVMRFLATIGSLLLALSKARARDRTTLGGGRATEGAQRRVRSDGAPWRGSRPGWWKARPVYDAPF